MRLLRKVWRAYWLRSCGRRLMWRYIATVEEICGQFTYADCAFAEDVCPRLRRKRRRARACARLLTIQFQS